MKRSLKAARFSDFAFLRPGQAAAFPFFMKSGRFFIFRLFLPPAAKNPLFYRLENPCRCNVMTYDDTHRKVCKSMN